VTGHEVATLALLYAGVGVAHWLVRRPLLAASFGGRHLEDPRVLAWDALFYASFAVVVTSSVRVAGVLLVFAFLVVPAAIAALLVRGLTRRLLLAWLVGAGVSAIGLVASYRWDLPTGAAVVSAFGAALGLTALALGTRATVRAVRARGVTAVRPGAALLAALVGVAGLLLLLAPGLDHPWLDAVERIAPGVQESFLTPGERAARRDARAAVERGERQLAELRTLQQDAQWGTRRLDADTQERLRQFLAGRGELTAGDRMVLRTLRDRARERQRYWLGVPLLALGTGGALVLARRSR